jgi:hypothetical protein
MRLNKMYKVPEMQGWFMCEQKMLHGLPHHGLAVKQ